DGIASLREKFRAARHLVPALALIAAVIGSIYAGIATPTEAAVLGVLGSLILSLTTGSLDRRAFQASVMGAMKTFCVIASMLTGAAFLTVAMGFTGIPRAMADWIARQGLTPGQLVPVLTLLCL